MAAGDTNVTNLVASGNVTVAGTMAVTGAQTFTGALGLSASGFTMAAIARTATSDGLTTGTIAAGPALQFISVTSANSAHIVTLPAPTVGNIIILKVGANGFNLQSSTPASIAINGGTGASVKSAIGANAAVVIICTSSTTWQGFTIAAAGTLAAITPAA